LSTLNTLFVGKVAQHFPTLASSNDFAINLVAKTKPIEGTVISTAFQSKGKGQIGSSWFSSAGKNLLQSIIFYPKWLSVQDQFLLSQAMALAVADTLNIFSPIKATVKWPNDVYINDKKIAGILIQNGLLNSKISWSVVGIGLNVNEESFPDYLRQAASLKSLFNTHLNIENVQFTLYQYVEQRYLQLKSAPKKIAKQYLQNLYQYQSWAKYQNAQSGKIFNGQIIGINKSGHLAVRKEDNLNTVHYFDLKEIVFL